jgi:hypothetical protein
MSPPPCASTHTARQNKSFHGDETEMNLSDQF